MNLSLRHILTTGTVLKTSDQAYLRDLSDGIYSVDQQPGDRSGELSVALYAHRMHANGNISRLFIAGSSGLFTEEYVYQRTYVQQFIIMLMGQLLSDKIVTLDIMASAAVRPALPVGSQTVGTVPVSYTHLDVYKRQSLVKAAGSFTALSASILRLMEMLRCLRPFIRTE